MDERVRGAWVVHHASKIEDYGGSGQLNNLRKAGNCGMLLSALSATQQSQVDMATVTTLADTAGIDLTYQLPVLLETLEQQVLIERSASTVEVLGLTTRGVLEHTSKIFTGLGPLPIEEAAIDVAEFCSGAPRTGSELREYAADRHKLDHRGAGTLLSAVETVKLCDSEALDSKTTVYFNGALFRADSLKKTKAVIDSLTSADSSRITALSQRLKTEGCVEKADAAQILGDVLFKKLHSVGMYDVSTVSNDKETVEYVTQPAAFNKFGRSDISDAFDLAKALVASLEYGMSRSSSGRGRIVFLRRLMQKLVAGQAVGPCTAIGQDYRLLELRRVVQVIPAHAGMFSMRLLKRDVGELAMQVLESGDASERSLDALPGAPLSRYRGPETNRVRARKEAQQRNIDVRKALDTLRTQNL